MTKKTKTILGIVGGVVVLGSVGAAVGGNSSNDTSSLSSDTSVTSVVSSVSEVSAVSSVISSTSSAQSSKISESSSVTVSSTPTSTAAPPVSLVESIYSEPTVIESTPAQPVQTPPSNTTSENHFNDYSNTQQQNTKEYVLNTDSHVIHKPSCRHAKKIDEKNYSTTTDFDWAISQGYEPWKVCNPF